MRVRSASVLVAALAMALALPSSAPPAFAGRNGDLLFAKQRYVRYGSETNPSGDPPELLRANADGTHVRLVARLATGWWIAFHSRIDWRIR